MKLQALLVGLVLALGSVKASLKKSADGSVLLATQWSDGNDIFASSGIEAAELADQQRPQHPIILPEGQQTPSLFYPINPPSIPLAVKGPCE